MVKRELYLGRYSCYTCKGWNPVGPNTCDDAPVDLVYCPDYKHFEDSDD